MLNLFSCLAQRMANGNSRSPFRHAGPCVARIFLSGLRPHLPATSASFLIKRVTGIGSPRSSNPRLLLQTFYASSAIPASQLSRARLREHTSLTLMPPAKPSSGLVKISRNRNSRTGLSAGSSTTHHPSSRAKSAAAAPMTASSSTRLVSVAAPKVNSGKSKTRCPHCCANAASSSLLLLSSSC